MTSSHPWVADGFYLAAGLLFLGKFLTWEEASQTDPRKRLRLVAIGVTCTVVALTLAIFGNHKLSSQSPPSPNKEDIASEVWKRAPSTAPLLPHGEITKEGATPDRTQAPRISKPLAEPNASKLPVNSDDIPVPWLIVSGYRSQTENQACG